MTDSQNDACPRWPRWAARASLTAAFVCFALNCVFMQLTREQLPSETELANQIVGSLGLAILIAGIVSAAAALVGGWKHSSRETLVLALMGILLNGGVIAAMLWLRNQIDKAQLP